MAQKLIFLFRLTKLNIYVKMYQLFLCFLGGNRSMKFGMRKPSIKRSISARTTGKIKRKIKKTINPLYGKKGMGYINNPKKAIYNKVYHKTTFSVKDALGLSTRKRSTRASSNNRPGRFRVPLPIILIVVGLFTIPVGLIFIAIALFMIVMRNLQKPTNDADTDSQFEDETTNDEE